MEKCTLLFLWVSLSLSSVSALPRCERVKESKCSWECPEVNKVVNFRDNSEPIRYAWTFIATQSNGRMCTCSIIRVLVCSLCIFCCQSRSDHRHHGQTNRRVLSSCVISALMTKFSCLFHHTLNSHNPYTLTSPHTTVYSVPQATYTS